MVERMVFLRLKEEYRSDEKRTEIANYSENILSTVGQVRGVRATIALDDNTRQDWDILLAIRLDAPEELEPFRLDPIHRDYVDNYLKPKVDKIKGWNFV